MSEQNEPVPTEADINLIQQIIPHRYPFLLIDKVTNIVAGESAIGIKNVTYNEPHFQGHFPFQPIMPGVTMVEAMAQTAGVVAGLGIGVKGANLPIYFMSIDKCKFRKMVVPGDVLELHVSVMRRRTKIWRFEGIAKVDGVVVAEAEFVAMVGPQD